MIMMVMIVAVTFLIIVMIVIMIVVMMSATALLVVIMVMVVMLVIMVVTALALIIVVMVMVFVVMAVTFLPVVMVMVVVMIVAVALHVLIDLVEQSAVVDRVVHPVLELVFVHVEYSAHECEVDLLLGIKVPVLLDSVPQVCEVVCDSGAVVESDCSLDVSEHGTCLVLDPFSDLKHGPCEPGLGISVPAADPSGYSCGAAVCLFERCLLSAHSIIS